MPKYRRSHIKKSNPMSSKKFGALGGAAPRLKTKRELKPGQLLVQITLCARCGGRHSLLAYPLINPPADDPYKHFAMCRATRQPIWIQVTT